MKAEITKVTFQKEYESKYGLLYGFKVEYEGKTAFYSSKSKDQKKFQPGMIVEFIEEQRKNEKGRTYTVVKPIYDNAAKSNYGRKQKQEQSRYSGFAVSYAKDLAVAGLIGKDEIFPMSSALFEHMVKLDKTLS